MSHTPSIVNHARVTVMTFTSPPTTGPRARGDSNFQIVVCKGVRGRAIKETLWSGLGITVFSNGSQVTALVLRDRNTKVRVAEKKSFRCATEVMADRRVAHSDSRASDVPVRQPERQAYSISDEIQELNQTTAMMEQGPAKKSCSVSQARSFKPFRRVQNGFLAASPRCMCLSASADRAR